MIWDDLVTTYYFPCSHQRRALHAIFAVVFLAAVPATLGGLSQALSAIAPAGQDAATTAAQLGNQARGAALGDSADLVFGAQGELLALCTGTTDANLNCPSGLRQLSIE